MKKLLLFSLLLIFPLLANCQIDCNPTLGFRFKPIKKGVSLYQKPNLNSIVVLKSPAPDDIWLNCTNTNIINDFVEVEVDFLNGAFEENGVNSYLYWLHHYLTNQYGYDFDFKSFVRFIIVKENQKEVYNLIISDEKNDWFKDYSSSEDYDVSTFEGFYRNWIYYDRIKSNDDYIINNQGIKVYVHKNDITNKKGAFVLNGANSDYYFTYLEEQLKLKGENSCFYNEETLLVYFKFYANALIKEKEPFKVIKEINKYSYNFKETTSNFTLNFLKMKASYFDSNYTTAIEIGKKLVSLFDQNKISNSNNTFERGDLNMSQVYAFLISSLLKTDKYEKALKFSKKCDFDEKLQFEQHIEFYAISLLKFNQKTNACKILNQAYLDGNEYVRELLKKHCE